MTLWRVVGLVLLLAAMAAVTRGAGERWIVLALGVFLLVPLALSLWQQARFRRALFRADLEAVLFVLQNQAKDQDIGVYQLLAATAYAAFGFVEDARTALARASQTGTWVVALEQRVLVEVMLDVYEGERLRALRKAALLVELPLPRVEYAARRRVHILRQGIGALARAFARKPNPGDATRLEHTEKEVPVLVWAMRYARAILAVDAGHGEEVVRLLADAPPWSTKSAFAAYHTELLTHSPAGERP